MVKDGAVTNIIISKIESKSQHCHHQEFIQGSCNKYHYFKDRKQITTGATAKAEKKSCNKYHYFKDRKQITTGKATGTPTDQL